MKGAANDLSALKVTALARDDVAAVHHGMCCKPCPDPDNRQVYVELADNPLQGASGRIAMSLKQAMGR